MAIPGLDQITPEMLQEALRRLGLAQGQAAGPPPSPTDMQNLSADRQRLASSYGQSLGAIPHVMGTPSAAVVGAMQGAITPGASVIDEAKRNVLASPGQRAGVGDLMDQTEKNWASRSGMDVGQYRKANPMAGWLGDSPLGQTAKDVGGQLGDIGLDAGLGLAGGAASTIPAAARGAVTRSVAGGAPGALARMAAENPITPMFRNDIAKKFGSMPESAIGPVNTMPRTKAAVAEAYSPVTRGYQGDVGPMWRTQQIAPNRYNPTMTPEMMNKFIERFARRQDVPESDWVHDVNTFPGRPPNAGSMLEAEKMITPDAQMGVLTGGRPSQKIPVSSIPQAASRISDNMAGEIEDAVLKKQPGVSPGTEAPSGTSSSVEIPIYDGPLGQPAAATNDVTRGTYYQYMKGLGDAWGGPENYKSLGLDPLVKSLGLGSGPGMPLPKDSIWLPDYRRYSPNAARGRYKSPK